MLGADDGFVHLAIPAGLRRDLPSRKAGGGRETQKRPPLALPYERAAVLLPEQRERRAAGLLRDHQAILRVPEHGRALDRGRHHQLCHGSLALRGLRAPVEAPRQRPGVRGGPRRVLHHGVLQRLVHGRRAQPAALPQLPEGALRFEALLERPPRAHGLGHPEHLLPGRHVLQLPAPDGLQQQRLALLRRSCCKVRVHPGLILGRRHRRVL
mmetsp:Transcript_75439/g.208172  ORF Transcript_75439/g.208172 Transcript_75439/m.208172 type:complete len:211 (+) Transcript_75439:322-954(+)